MTRPDPQSVTLAMLWTVVALDAHPWDADPDVLELQKDILRALQVKTLNNWWRVG